MDPQIQDNYQFDYQADDNYYQDCMQPQLQANLYQILPQSSVFNQIKDLVNQTMQTIALPFGWSLLLLKQFKWQVDFLGDYFQSMDKYKNSIGYSNKLLTTQQCKKLYRQGQCAICLSNDELIVNICKDGFCRNCWSSHIQQHLNNLNPFMKCMNCTAPLLYQTICDILNKTKNNKIYNKYQKQICQFFTNTSRSYQCCPGADCNYCIKCQNYSVMTVKCICGKSFCFKCQSDDHSPCTCMQKNKWVQIVLKQQANAKWIAQNTKLCPWCNKAVERSQGCNFMACLCGKSFCYMCSKPWQPDHKDHFKCHIYKKRNDDQVSRQKAVLQKLNFYAQKYLNTNSVIGSLKKFDTFQKRRLLYEQLNIDLTQSDFIDQAYKFAIQCCQSLKWIYVYTYFVQILDYNRKQRFLFSQGQFQSFKQQLLKKLSYQLKNFLVKIQKKLQLNHGKLKPEDKKKYTQQFWNLKTNIINYYRFTKQFKQKFVEEIQSIDSNMIKRNHQYTEDKEKVQDKKNQKKGSKKK